MSAAENGSVAHASGIAPAFSAGVPTVESGLRAHRRSRPTNTARRCSSAPNSRAAAERSARASRSRRRPARFDVADPLARQRPRVAEFLPLPAMIGSEHVDAIGIQRHLSMSAYVRIVLGRRPAGRPRTGAWRPGPAGNNRVHTRTYRGRSFRSRSRAGTRGCAIGAGGRRAETRQHVLLDDDPAVRSRGLAARRARGRTERRRDRARRRCRGARTSW